jgi:Zn-dependent protease with chaperone function
MDAGILKFSLQTALALIYFSFPNVVRAEDVQPISFQSKIENMEDALNKFRKNSASNYSIQAVTNGNIAETNVWSRGPNGFGMNIRCEIKINQRLVENSNMTDDTLAWMIGHELGHCELKHNQIKLMVTIPSDSWKQEYDADLVGKRLMLAAGYNFDDAVPGIIALLGYMESSTHPDGPSRLENLNTLGYEKHYPSIINTRPRVRIAVGEP